MKRYVILYLATFIVLLPLDFLFLGVIAKGVFTQQVGDMLGEVRWTPAILFYLLYIAGRARVSPRGDEAVRCEKNIAAA